MSACSRLSLAITLAASLAVPSLAINYPTLDTTSHWTLQDWGFNPGLGFYVRGARKNIWVGEGQSQSRLVFYDLSAKGVRIGNQAYRLENAEYLGQMDLPTSVVRYANFKVLPDLLVGVVYYFHDNGEFETYAYLQGAAYTPGAPWELILRADYDLKDAGNNIAEFLWNNASERGDVAPPRFPESEAQDGRLAYTASRAAPPYWAALPHEITVAYPPLGPGEGDGIERSGLARILSASHPQFGMVLWGDANGHAEVTFRAYGGHDQNLDPVGNPAASLQVTSGEGTSLPPYAYAGRDQMLLLKLRFPPDGIIRFRAKVFQRPQSRPLNVRVFQHPPEYLGGWTFGADYPARSYGEGPRTFRQALEQLAGPGNVHIATAADGLPYLPYQGYAQPGAPIDESQLHSLMARSRALLPLDYGSVRDNQVDLFLVDWTLQGEPGVWERMFDRGGGDLNRIGREGAAVFWPNLAGRGTDFQRGQAVLSALHGLGSALNLQPAWSNCPFAGYCWSDPGSCGGVRCGASCPPGAPGCRYAAHTCEHECAEGTIMSLTDITRNSLRFNSAPAPGSPHSEVDWYRYAPEAWTKPGRFGVAPFQGPQLPGFQRP